MAIKNKIWYSERILSELFPLRTRDEKIDPREVILVMDSVCTEMAKANMLEAWQLGFTNSIDDNFLTTFTGLTPTDPADGKESYLTLPATYASIPNNQGIVSVSFTNDFNTAKKKYFDTVLVLQYRSISAFRNTMAADLGGRIGCFPKANLLYFTKGFIFRDYGTVEMQLLIRDSAAIASDAIYPISGDMEIEFITRCVAHFKARLQQPADVLRDNNQNSKSV